MNKSFLRSLLFYLIVAQMLGCASALVPESNDPKVKVTQARILFMEQNRPQAAVSLLNQAIDLAEQKNNIKIQAEATWMLGEIFKTPGPRGQELLNPNKAIDQYKKAAQLYRSIQYFKHESFNYWSASGAHEALGNKKAECESLVISKERYMQKGANPEETLPAFLADGKLIDSINLLLKEKNCI